MSMPALRRGDDYIDIALGVMKGNLLPFAVIMRHLEHLPDQLPEVSNFRQVDLTLSLIRTMGVLTFIFISLYLE